MGLAVGQCHTVLLAGGGGTHACHIAPSTPGPGKVVCSLVPRQSARDAAASHHDGCQVAEGGAPPAWSCLAPRAWPCPGRGSPAPAWRSLASAGVRWRPTQELLIVLWSATDINLLGGPDTWSRRAAAHAPRRLGMLIRQARNEFRNIFNPELGAADLEHT